MHYTFSCPACGQKFTVTADNDDEAVTQFNEAGKKHAMEAHPTMPPMSEEQMADMVRQGMKKDEA